MPRRERAGVPALATNNDCNASGNNLQDDEEHSVTEGLVARHHGQPAHTTIALNDGSVEAAARSAYDRASYALSKATGLAALTNRNVSLTFCYNCLDGACYSVWGALLLPVLIEKVSGDAAVGAAAAAAGVAQLAAAGIAGCYGDGTTRQSFIRLGAACATAGIALFVVVVSLSSARDADGEHHDDSSGGGASFSSLTMLLQTSSAAPHALMETSPRQCLAGLFIGAQAVWGMYTGFVSTSTEALFADSVRSGERTAIYNVKWMVQTLCYLFGYLAALLMLLTLGNDWTLSSVCRVMLAGLLAHPFALVTLLFLKDSNALPASPADEAEPLAAASTAVVLAVEVEEENAASRDGVAARGADVYEAENCQRRFSSDSARTKRQAHEGSERRESAGRQAPEAVSAGDGDNHTDGSPTARASQSIQERIARELAAQEQQQRLRVMQRLVPSGNCCLLSSLCRLCEQCREFCFYRLCSWQAVPYLVCLVDFLMALGSGMTLLYFPLFLKNAVGVSPALMYITYIVSTCLTAVTSHAAQALAERWWHRIPSVILVRSIGSLLLLLLGVLPVYLPDSDESADGPDRQQQRQRRPGAVPLFTSLFVLRNACMNAVMGMTRSVIMDAVKKESRAKWSAFESFSSFTWAGSAMIGGYLVERKGYQFNFTVTALFHLSAGLLLVPAAVGAHRIECILKEKK